MSTNDPEFYQAPKFTPEPSAGAASPARLLLLRVHHRQRSGGADGDPRGDRRLLRLTAALNQLVEEYTATAPRELPKVEMPAEQRQALKDRVEAFRKAVEAGTPTEPLV